MQLRITKDQVIETDDLTINELLDIKDDMQLAMDQMNGDIMEAKAIRQATGEYADIGWFKRINLALKITRTNKDKLIRVFTERKKIERQNDPEQQRFERVFMQVVFETLGREQYMQITQETHRRIDASIEA